MYLFMWMCQRQEKKTESCKRESDMIRIQKKVSHS